MGWSIGYDKKWNRDVGYGVPAFCDHPACNEKIDRGLAYVCCNQELYGGDDGCGLYFCDKHNFREGCERCFAGLPPFDPKPEHPEWIEHRETDPSWEEWRNLRHLVPLLLLAFVLGMTAGCGRLQAQTVIDCDNAGCHYPGETIIEAPKEKEMDYSSHIDSISTALDFLIWSGVIAIIVSAIQRGMMIAEVSDFKTELRSSLEKLTDKLDGIETATFDLADHAKTTLYNSAGLKVDSDS